MCLADGEWRDPVQSSKCSISCGGGKAFYTFTSCFKKFNFSKDCNESNKVVLLDCPNIACPTSCEFEKFFLFVFKSLFIFIFLFLYKNCYFCKSNFTKEKLLYLLACQVMKDKACGDVNEMYRNFIPSLPDLRIDVVNMNEVLNQLTIFNIDSVQIMLNGNLICISLRTLKMIKSF